MLKVDMAEGNNHINFWNLFYIGKLNLIIPVVLKELCQLRRWREKDQCLFDSGSIQIWLLWVPFKEKCSTKLPGRIVVAPVKEWTQSKWRITQHCNCESSVTQQEFLIFLVQTVKELITWRVGAIQLAPLKSSNPPWEGCTAEPHTLKTNQGFHWAVCAHKQTPKD